MPLNKLVFKPGINRDQTNYATEGGWYACDAIRFRSGYPEKIGGWQVATFNAYDGVCRSLLPYVTSTSVPLTGIGTNTKIYVNAGTTIHDITPIRQTFTTTATDNCFAASSGSATVTVNINAHGALAGNFVTFTGAANGAGIAAEAWNREYEVLTATNNSFTISLGDFVGTGSISGTTLTITAVTSGFLDVGAPITGSGVSANTYITQLVAGSGGVGTYVVNNSQTVSSTTLSNRATSTTSVGGTAIVAAFQIRTGNASITAGFGWGTGQWAAGPGVGVTAATAARTWGSGSNLPVNLPARLIFQDKFNDDLIFNVRDETGSSLYGTGVNESNIFYWTYNSAFNTRAVNMTAVPNAIAVPRQVGQILFAPSGHLLALSCTNYDPLNGANDYVGTYDPLLIRWASVNADSGPEPWVWQPNLENTTAGFLRIQAGSRIITGFRTRQEILIFTDYSLTSLQFTETLEVFSQNELSNNISIYGPNVVASANNVVYWMGVDKFYMYNGRVDTLPCTLRQFIYEDINSELSDLFFSGTNAQFNEVIWFYVSANANEINRYVIYNYQENIWYYGELNRTAWSDQGSIVFPIAAHDGYLYNHETGNDNGQPNGQPNLPIDSWIQSADFDIEDGNKFMLIRRIIPDVNFTGSVTFDQDTQTALTPEVYITVGVRNFPGAASATTNASGNSNQRDVITATATVDQYTNQVFVRARGRQMNFKIGSDNLGTQWQLGIPRLDAREDGRRG